MLLTTRRLPGVAALVALVGAGVLAGPAPAALAAVRVTTLSTAYLNPAQLAVHGSTILVTDGDRLTRVGSATQIARGPSRGDLIGVAFNADGTSYAYGSTNRTHTGSWLTIVTPGAPTVSASLWAYEKQFNPDRKVTYGVDRPSACVRAAFKALDGGPANYLGKVDSHPYAVASAGTSWYVADQGANDILQVNAAGKVSGVVVLPRQPFVFSARLAAGLGLPKCVAGVTYNAEPVPTDVEVGPDGSLYVTTLPGLYDLGQTGSLYKIDPKTKKITRIGVGFAGATNVAITSTGHIYVAELLSGKVSSVQRGRPVPLVSLPGVTGLEAEGTVLYAAVRAPVTNGIRTGPGRIVRIG